MALVAGRLAISMSMMRDGARLSSMDARALLGLLRG